MTSGTSNHDRVMVIDVNSGESLYVTNAQAMLLQVMEGIPEEDILICGRFIEVLKKAWGRADGR